MEQLEHPAISRCLDSGYPYPLCGGESWREDDEDTYRLAAERDT